MRAIRQLAHWLRPPRGVEVRRFLAGICLAIAIPRLPYAQDIFDFAPQKFGPPELYGFFFLLAGVGLLATLGQRRVELSGRLFAGLAFVMFVTLAVTTSSATSWLIDSGCALVAFDEMIAMRNE